MQIDLYLAMLFETGTRSLVHNDHSSRYIKLLFLVNSFSLVP